MQCDELIAGKKSYFNAFYSNESYTELYNLEIIAMLCSVRVVNSLWNIVAVSVETINGQKRLES